MPTWRVCDAVLSAQFWRGAGVCCVADVQGCSAGHVRAGVVSRADSVIVDALGAAPSNVRCFLSAVRSESADCADQPCFAIPSTPSRSSWGELARRARIRTAVKKHLFQYRQLGIAIEQTMRRRVLNNGQSLTYLVGKPSLYATPTAARAFRRVCRNARRPSPRGRRASRLGRAGLMVSRWRIAPATGG